MPTPFLVPFTEAEIAAEEWRPVADFPRYLISSLGRYRWADPTAKWARVGTFIGVPWGRYMLARFPVEGRPPANFRVHVLVAAAFLGPRPPGMFVCHADDNGRNNRLSNLRYDTPTANAADAKRNGRVTNCLDAYAHLFGVVPDSEIAKRAGCARQFVHRMRTRAAQSPAYP